MKIFKAEQWNIEVLAPLFEAYRLANGMSENPDRTLTFLTNRTGGWFCSTLPSLIFFTTTTLLAIN